MKNAEFKFLSTNFAHLSEDLWESEEKSISNILKSIESFGKYKKFVRKQLGGETVLLQMHRLS